MEEAVGIDDLKNLAALNALDEDFDIAVGQLQALYDIDDRADLVDLVRLGLVHARVVLRGEKDLAIAGKRLFECPDAGFASDHERRHHVRKNDDVPNGHHGQLACFEFFPGLGHSVPSLVLKTKLVLTTQAYIADALDRKLSSTHTGKSSAQKVPSPLFPSLGWKRRAFRPFPCLPRTP